MKDEGEEQFEAGRAMVRDLVIHRLAAAGLKPRKGMSAVQHAEMVERLVGWLAYMAPANLAVLAESILTEAAKPGPALGHWPAEVLMRSWAEGLQVRPFRQHPIVASWLRSVEGPNAVAGGYLVELLRWLRRHRRPVTYHDLQMLRTEAADNQRRLAIARERIGWGRASPEDHQVMEAWQRDLAEALQYVDDGNAGRAAKAAAGEADEVAA